MTIPSLKWPGFSPAAGVRLVGIVIIAFLLNRLLHMMTNWLIKPAASATRVAQLREEQTRTLAGILYSAGTALILLIAVLTALPEFGFSITPIAALGGLASLALGFGAQNLVRDFINGFFIVFEDQFVVGDMIRIGEVVGRVEHVTLRRTLLRDLHGGLVTIANGEIRQVSNLSRDWSQVFVDAQVADEGAVDAALKALERTCSELRTDSSWSAALVDGPRVLGVESFGPSGVTLRVQVRAAPNRQYDVARELRRRILARFAEEQIRLSGAQKVELVASERDAESVPGRLSQK
jgi:small conductance mechanosensitive channel